MDKKKKLASGALALVLSAGLLVPTVSSLADDADNATNNAVAAVTEEVKSAENKSDEEVKPSEEAKPAENEKPAEKPAEEVRYEYTVVELDGTVRGPFQFTMDQIQADIAELNEIYGTNLTVPKPVDGKITVDFNATDNDDSEEPEVELYTVVVREPDGYNEDGSVKVKEYKAFVGLEGWDLAVEKASDLDKELAEFYGVSQKGVAATGNTIVLDYSDAVAAKPEEQPEEKPEVQEYFARYELRDEDGNLVELLQEEKYDSWDKLQAGSIVIAESYKDQYNRVGVEASADGITYVFNEHKAQVGDEVFNEDKPYYDTDQLEQEFYARYELRDEDGNLVKLLQEDKYNSWEDLQALSYATSEAFKDEYVKVGVEASADGITYVYNEKDEEVEEPEVKEFYARYELRDEDGNLVKLLQEDKYNSWEDLDVLSYATSESFKELYNKVGVEATAEGITYVYNEKDEETEEPEVKEFYARYELRDEEGNLIKLLQEDKYNSWQDLEVLSFATSESFKELYNKVGVEAT
ncbi:MAG: hypothetical protein Q4B52_03930, partial [Tissierellia bacterium]|nr:hypothetical protein [Tissierellia bacterium]